MPALDAATVAAYDKPVPRCTSHPTAAQFDRSIGPSQHEVWLGDLNGDLAALYLHVPFCRQLCWYCASHTVAMRHEETLESYARALEAELDRVPQAAPDLMVGTIQWGGGPSQLGPQRLPRRGRYIARRFYRRSGSETSMEVDPRY